MSMKLRTLFVIFLSLVLGLLTACDSQAEIEPEAASAAVVEEASETISPASLPFASNTDWIAFQREDSNDRVGVWLVHPDGSEEHQIFTDVEAEVRYPSWSPDGTHLVVTSLGGVTSEPLYEYDLETKSSRELFPCPTDDPCYRFFDEPSYSPDGKSVAFVRASGEFVFNEDLGHMAPTLCGLWIGDLDSGELAEITRNEKCDREYSPRWSPDGTQFVYTYDPYADGKPLGTSVYVMNADGSEKRQLTDDALVGGDASWSPDGQWIVFSTYPLGEYSAPPGPSNLYRVRPDGSGLEQLTFNETTSLRATLPFYSPDGEWITFTAVTPSDRSLWAIPADGGESVVIAQGRGLPNNYTYGVWQP